MTSAIRAKISFTSGREFRAGEEETKRYSDLECALDDCLVKSQSNKVIVSKRWNKTAEDPIDYDIEIVDTSPEEKPKEELFKVIDDINKEQLQQEEQEPEQDQEQEEEEEEVKEEKVPVKRNLFRKQ